MSINVNVNGIYVFEFDESCKYTFLCVLHPMNIVNIFYTYDYVIVTFIIILILNQLGETLRYDWLPKRTETRRLPDYCARTIPGKQTS